MIPHWDVDDVGHGGGGRGRARRGRQIIALAVEECRRPEEEEGKVKLLVALMRQ